MAKRSVTKFFITHFYVLLNAPLKELIRVFAFLFFGHLFLLAFLYLFLFFEQYVIRPFLQAIYFFLQKVNWFYIGAFYFALRLEQHYLRGLKWNLQNIAKYFKPHMTFFFGLFGLQHSLKDTTRFIKDLTRFIRNYNVPRNWKKLAQIIFDFYY